MLTQLNIPAPPARQLERVTLIELVAPIVAAERYFGVVRRREGESTFCAVVTPTGRLICMRPHSRCCYRC